MSKRAVLGLAIGFACLSWAWAGEGDKPPAQRFALTHRFVPGKYTLVNREEFEAQDDHQSSYVEVTLEIHPAGDDGKKKAQVRPRRFNEKIENEHEVCIYDSSIPAGNNVSSRKKFGQADGGPGTQPASRKPSATESNLRQRARLFDALVKERQDIEIKRDDTIGRVAWSEPEALKEWLGEAEGALLPETVIGIMAPSRAILPPKAVAVGEKWATSERWGEEAIHHECELRAIEDTKQGRIALVRDVFKTAGGWEQPKDDAGIPDDPKGRRLRSWVEGASEVRLNLDNPMLVDIKGERTFFHDSESQGKVSLHKQVSRTERSIRPLNGDR